MSLEVESGEFYTLLGPSGCGKTTLLRMIAGFNTIEAGDIHFDETRINDMDPAKRHIGMVFQDYALFPHLTAQQNVEFGLRNQKEERSARTKKAREYLELVQMAAWADRRPDHLSGGQQQRVALARALVTSPGVLLMDEPLSNLDAKLRIEMREAIRDIQRNVGITTVYVTHDQEEAMAVSDRIAVMKDGVIQQVGTPASLYSRPGNTFVAGFFGTNNILPGTLAVEGDTPVLTVAGVATALPPSSVAAGSARAVQVSVRPEHLHVGARDSSGIATLITGRTFLGRDTHYTCRLADSTIVELVLRSDFQSPLKPGSEVGLHIDPRNINVYTQDGTQNLSLGASATAS
ncbi:MAG: ABC transporter ATP-binding protein [Burkholderiales bacterium]|nr:ABC transporter ATP-binding protein [Burkholderiales bacterium]